MWKIKKFLFIYVAYVDEDKKRERKKAINSLVALEGCEPIFSGPSLKKENLDKYEKLNDFPTRSVTFRNKETGETYIFIPPVPTP